MAIQDLSSLSTKSKASALPAGLSWRLIIIVVLALGLGFSLTYYISNQVAPDGLPPGSGPVLGEFGTQVCQSGQCGDGICLQGFGVCADAQENCENCPADCPCECVPQCGDGICSECEGAFNCVADCGNFCGDQICAAEEVDSCCGPGLDCTVAITCGDGICSACESAGNCPVDCEGVETEVPTEEVTETPTEVVTEPPPVVTDPPEETEEPTEPPTETPTATSTETETPTATPSETPSATPEPEEVCGLVPYESRPGGWKESYGGASDPGDYIPINDENLEVYVCDEPPAETVCIPLYGDLLDAADGDEARVLVLDCPDGGECRTYEEVARVVGDEMCFSPTETSGIDCGVGCAFAPLMLEAPGPDLPLPLWALGLIILGLLLLLLLLFILLSRRRREAEEEEAGID